MIINERRSPVAPESIHRKVRRDVEGALNAITTVDNEFVVNDTVWYMERPNGSITPAVMNQADFLSGNFLRILRDEYGWEKEKEILQQRFDAFTAIHVDEAVYKIREDDFTRFFQTMEENSDLATMLEDFIRYYNEYVRRGLSDLEGISELYRPFFAFIQPDENSTIRVGLEFETGNISSAFRALMKLEFLYRAQEIDLGVFITSRDKQNVAARIWPQSNRNGSFEELDQRNYQQVLTVPLWEFAFAPDRYDRTAPFLAGDGSLYEIQETAETVVHNGTTYQVYIRGDTERVLLPL